MIIIITPLAVEDRVANSVSIEVEGIVGLEVSESQC